MVQHGGSGAYVRVHDNFTLLSDKKHMSFSSIFRSSRLPRVVFGMRARLLLLGLFAATPIVLLEIRNADTLEQQTIADTHVEARLMASEANGRYDDIILQAKTTLEFLSDTPAVKNQDISACNQLMKNTVMRYTWYTAAFVKDINGDTICYNQDKYLNVNIGDEDYFKEVLRTKRFTVGNFIIGPISHKPVVVALQPVLDEQGNVVSVVGAPINLTVFNSLLEGHETGSASVTIFDGTGTVLARYPDGGKFIGMNVSKTPLFEMAKRSGSGEIETIGLAGDKRIFAFEPFADVDSYIAVGIPKQPILDAARHRLSRNLAVIAAVLLAVGTALILMFEILIVRPAKYLGEAAIAMGDGNYDAVPQIRTSMLEIDRLLSSFKRMAASLRQRETELKASEQSAQTLNRNLTLGEQIANAGYWRVEFPSQSLHWSTGVYRIFGHDPRTFEPTLTSAISCIHPDDRQTVAESIELAFAVQRDFDYTVRIIRADGIVRYMQSRGFCEIGPDGQVSGLFGAILDVTRVKEIEEGLSNARRAAETANRAKSDFLSSMSHELRTPLTSIIGFADLMLMRESSDTTRRYLTLQRESGQHLLSLISDILDHSKIEAGKLQLEAVPFDLRALAQSCHEAMSFEASRKGLDLDMTMGVTVPNYVVGDPGRLKQVILNLMSNAIKFTQAGMVSLDVSLHGMAGDVAALGFSVRDTGIGIAKDKAERLFQRYVQAESSTARQYGGTGLGLSISKSLVEAMGGSIGVESVPGTGSTFWFNIRLLSADDVQEGSGVRNRIAAKRRSRILLAEDSPVNQLLFTELLMALGHEVQVVERRRAEAVAAVSAGAFDLDPDGCPDAGHGWI